MRIVRNGFYGRSCDELRECTTRTGAAADGRHASAPSATPMKRFEGATLPAGADDVARIAVRERASVIARNPTVAPEIRSLRTRRTNRHGSFRFARSVRCGPANVHLRATDDGTGTDAGTAVSARPVSAVVRRPVLPPRCRRRVSARQPRPFRGNAAGRRSWPVAPVAR